MSTRLTAEERYRSKVDQRGPDECWPWLGKARGGKGKYGQMSVNNRSVSAHRFGWELAHGPIPDGMHVLHHCDNPICQNPRHWFLGDNAANVADKMAKGRWAGGRPKFTPGTCARCGRERQIVKGVCRPCYTTLRRQEGRYQR